MLPEIIFTILTVLAVRSQETNDFVNSANLCKRCECTLEDDNFILDCKEQNFNSIIANWPHEIVDNTNIKRIRASFSYNNITTLKKLPPTNLYLQVTLDHCGIKYIDPGVFDAIVNVEFVDLSYNQITSEILATEVFKGPMNNTVFDPLELKHLNLAYNKIRTLPANLFEHCVDIEELNLEGNDLHVLDIHTQLAIASLTKLKILNLANNELTEIPTNALLNLKFLETIDLSNNHFDFVPFELAAVEDSLKVLNLDSNIIFELTNESFLGLTNMQRLSLNNLPRLEYVEQGTFATMPNLKILELSNNKNLTSIHFEAFGSSRSLDEIYLNNNSLETIDFRMLDWSKLDVFQIHNNPLRCNCDLYNITQTLKEHVKANKDSPYCLQENFLRTVEMYLLTEGNCHIELRSAVEITHSFNKLRIALLSLSIIIVFFMFVLMAIAYSKYRRHIRLSSYVTQVQYNPLSNALI